MASTGGVERLIDLSMAFYGAGGGVHSILRSPWMAEQVEGIVTRLRARHSEALWVAEPAERSVITNRFHRLLLATDEVDVGATLVCATDRDEVPVGLMTVWPEDTRTTPYAINFIATSGAVRGAGAALLSTAAAVTSSSVSLIPFAEARPWYRGLGFVPEESRNSRLVLPPSACVAVRNALDGGLTGREFG